MADHPTRSVLVHWSMFVISGTLPQTIYHLSIPRKIVIDKITKKQSTEIEYKAFGALEGLTRRLLEDRWMPSHPGYTWHYKQHVTGTYANRCPLRLTFLFAVAPSSGQTAAICGGVAPAVAPLFSLCPGLKIWVAVPWVFYCNSAQVNIKKSCIEPPPHYNGYTCSIHTRHKQVVCGFKIMYASKVWRRNSLAWMTKNANAVDES